ncbi:MAG: hypothetical protein MZV64_48310 [Ignavibacteriales bacterium]|nr:hypothetical protein [Ignavibacteriales bacterium]
MNSIQAIITAWGDEPFSEEIRDIVTSMGLEYWYGTPGDFLFALTMQASSMKILLMEIENL